MKGYLGIVCVKLSGRDFITLKSYRYVFKIKYAVIN